MKTEIEAKFLSIHPSALRDKLRSMGADLLQPEQLYRRKTFDHPDDRLMKKGGWVRVRDEGTQITLSYKELQDRSLHGTKEATVKVDSFDGTCEFLLDVGLVENSYQETRREIWKLESVEVVLDVWPWIAPLAEIEGESEGAVRAAVEKLGLLWSDAVHGSVEVAYMREYDVTEQEIDRWPSITFVPVPDWLQRKRRK